MPKIVNESEKKKVLEAIYKNTIELIKEKGLRAVSVDNITQRVCMAKGSFYKYYQSREICLYEVIKHSENEVFDRLESTLSESSPNRELLIKGLHEIYLADDSIALYVTPKDVEWLMRKLPPEYTERERKKAEDFLERTMYIMGINPTTFNTGILIHLMDSLAFIASRKDISHDNAEKKKAMELIVHTIADYLMGGISQ